MVWSSLPKLRLRITPTNSRSVSSMVTRSPISGTGRSLSATKATSSSSCRVMEALSPLHVQ